MSDQPELTLISGWESVPRPLRTCPECLHSHGICPICNVAPLSCDSKNGLPSEPYSRCNLCEARAQAAEDAALALAGDGGSVMNAPGEPYAYIITEMGDPWNASLTSSKCAACGQDDAVEEMPCGAMVHDEDQAEPDQPSCRELHLENCDRCTVAL